MVLFNLIPKKDGDENSIPSDFNESLKTALDYNPKKMTNFFKFFCRNRSVGH
jgi:hypothetical protein